jgi:DNA repair exonuclease SbcCD ATPase subunit
LKTAGTVALGAACVAFPAVGLAACAVGAVAGGAKIVTNVGKAMTAENDAEAKAAWEEVGSGGVVTAMSVAGAKASYGAMEGSLGESAALGNKGLVENIQENGFLQTAKNLKTDATTSVKNNFAEIRDNFSVFKNDINATKNVKEYKELLSKKASGEELSEAEAAKLEEFQYDTKLTEKVNQLEEQEIKVGRAKKQYTKEKEAYDKELAELKQQKSEIETDLEVAGEDDPYFAQNKAELEDINAKIDELNTNFAKTQSEYDTTMAQNTFGGKVKSAYADSKAKASEMVDSLKGKKFDLAGFKSKLSKENLTDAAISLGTRGKAIINDIMTSDLDGLVEKYGYENLGEILSTISGAVAMDNSV